MRCRPGTLRWYQSLGQPVPGFEHLFDAESDARYLRWYAGASFNVVKDQEGDANTDL